MGAMSAPLEVEADHAAQLWHPARILVEARHLDGEVDLVEAEDDVEDDPYAKYIDDDEDDEAEDEPATRAR